MWREKKNKMKRRIHRKSKRIGIMHNNNNRTAVWETEGFSQRLRQWYETPQRMGMQISCKEYHYINIMPWCIFHPYYFHSPYVKFIGKFEPCVYINIDFPNSDLFFCFFIFFDWFPTANHTLHRNCILLSASCCCCCCCLV